MTLEEELDRAKALLIEQHNHIQKLERDKFRIDHAELHKYCLYCMARATTIIIGLLILEPNNHTNLKRCEKPWIGRLLTPRQ